MRQHLTEVYGLHQGIHVGDRGMKSQGVVEDFHRYGFHYVVAEVNQNMEEVFLEAYGRRAVRQGKNLAREVAGSDGRRFIGLLNKEKRLH